MYLSWPNGPPWDLEMLLEHRKELPVEPLESAVQKLSSASQALTRMSEFFVTVIYPMEAILHPVDMQTSESRFFIICIFRNVEFV